MLSHSSGHAGLVGHRMQTLRAYSGNVYVRVEARSRGANRWGWSLCQENSDIAFERSGSLYRCAEDALKAGRDALANLPAHMKKAG